VAVDFLAALDFLATVARFLGAADFFTVVLAAVDFAAVDFAAVDFAVDFLAVDALAVVVGFFATDFLAGAFLAVDLAAPASDFANLPAALLTSLARPCSAAARPVNATSTLRDVAYVETLERIVATADEPTCLPDVRTSLSDSASSSSRDSMRRSSASLLGERP